MNQTLYRRYGKRCLDVLFATLALIVFAPIFLLAALAVALSSRGPIFYRQRRAGLHGEAFQIFKFRTMVCGAERKGSLVTATNDSRITMIGGLLRRTKIDEFPQFLNVLRGEMSLVGPRPEVPRFIARYNLWQRRIFVARPGITGPATIAFVNEADMLALHSDREAYYVNHILPAKLELDLHYCENIRFLTDLRLIFRTLLLLFRADKSLHPSAKSPATMRSQFER